MARAAPVVPVTLQDQATGRIVGTMPCAASLRMVSLFVGSAISAAAQAPLRDTLIAVTHTRVRSAALGQTRDVFVWLPDADASVRRYPVLVMLDAQDRNNFRSLLANVRFLIDRKVIPPIMVVGVPFGASREHDLTP